MPAAAGGGSIGARHDTTPSGDYVHHEWGDGAHNGRHASTENQPWEARFPGNFTVRDGYVRTDEPGGPGLGIPAEILPPGG